MSFSNPASGAIEEAAAYTRAVLGLLGDRDPIVVFEEQAKSVRSLLEGLTRDQLNRPEKPGKWSITQVVQHLADSELVFGFRMRMALAHERPPLIGIDQDAWADRLHYDSVNLEDALEQLSSLRKANLKLIRNLTGDELSRVGVHAERGPETVAHMIRLIAGHDLVHRNQIARIRAAVA